jgi:hypothetical protein
LAVHFQLTNELAGILAQLKNKDILPQSIECPLCNSKLDYPEGGTVIKCKYRGASVNAIDVFEKFKSLLGF